MPSESVLSGLILESIFKFLLSCKSLAPLRWGVNKSKSNCIDEIIDATILTFVCRLFIAESAKIGANI